MSAGLYTHTTRATGTILTAAIYNTDHQNHITNHNPSMIGSLSDSVAEMQGMVDPGGVGSESLAGSLAAELQRLRFAIDRIVGGAQWYSAPSADLATLANGVFSDLVVSQSVVLSGDVTPAQITADQNNYNPASLADAFRLRISSDAAWTITGIAGGAAGRMVLLHNVGAFAITLANENASSAAANRFTLGQNFLLGAGAALLFHWNTTTSRWIPEAFYAASATQAEAEAGTATVPRIWTPQRISQAISALEPFGNQLLHIRDEKASGTAGGTFTSGAWQTRVLNTVKTNEITGASLATNQITLPTGIYNIDASAPASFGNQSGAETHQAKLANITDVSDIIIGTGEWLEGDTGPNIITQTRSHIRGRFTLAAQKVVELQHRISASQTTTGFGRAAGFGVVEVYADVMIWKIG